MEKLIKIIENKGWSFEESDDSYYIKQHSPAGEDYGFNIHKDQAEDKIDLIEQIYKRWQQFDPEEHAEFLIIARHEGAKGIPGAEILIQDAYKIDEMLYDLKEALQSHLTEIIMNPQKPKKQTQKLEDLTEIISKENIDKIVEFGKKHNATTSTVPGAKPYFNNNEYFLSIDIWSLSDEEYNELIILLEEQEIEFAYARDAFWMLLRTDKNEI